MYIPTVILRVDEQSSRERRATEAQLGRLAARWSRLVRRVRR